MGLASLLCSCRNRISAVRSVAEYMFTGTVTSPKVMAPFHMGRGMTVRGAKAVPARTPRPCPRAPPLPVPPRPGEGVSAKLRQDFFGEALELGELVVADQADAEVGDAGGGVPLDHVDDDVGGAEPHRATLVDVAAIVGAEELSGYALGGAHVVVQADG